MANMLKNKRWNVESERNLFAELATKLNIRHPSDWGKISVQTVLKNGGGSVMANKYNNSLIKALHSNYPGWITNRRLIC